MQADRIGFWWRDRDCSSYGELGSTLCSMETAEDAAEFWGAYVEYLNRPDAQLLGRSAEEVASSNIGYLMGYYGTEDRDRVYGLFPLASHPIFGRFESAPTAEDALDAGAKMMIGARRARSNDA